MTTLPDALADLVSEDAAAAVRDLTLPDGAQVISTGPVRFRSDGSMHETADHVWVRHPDGWSVWLDNHRARIGATARGCTAAYASADEVAANVGVVLVSVAEALTGGASPQDALRDAVAQAAAESTSA